MTPPVTAPGTELPPFVMTGIDMERVHVVMEVMHDVNPMHDDLALIEERGLRGPVNQGPANLSYVVNMLHAWAGPELVLERLEFEFKDIVVPGDTVTARGAVTEEERLEAAVRVTCDVRLELEDGTPAVVGRARLRIPAG